MRFFKTALFRLKNKVYRACPCTTPALCATLAPANHIVHIEPFLTSVSSSQVEAKFHIFLSVPAPVVFLSYQTILLYPCSTLSPKG